MKTLIESILDNQEQQIEKTKKKAAVHISYTKFKSDIEEILKQCGWNIVRSAASTDKIQSVFIDRVSEPINTTMIDIDRYTLHYAWKNEYGEKFGYGVHSTGFSLILYTWKDPELKRPRYRFETFSLDLPSTSKGGYKMDWNETFGAKKILPEHYDKAISHIRGIIRDYVEGFSVIDRMWNKSQNKNPQKMDFNKVKKAIFGDKISTM